MYVLRIWVIRLDVTVLIMASYGSTMSVSPRPIYSIGVIVFCFCFCVSVGRYEKVDTREPRYTVPVVDTIDSMVMILYFYCCVYYICIIFLLF